jgi:hypothetical protein
MTSDAPPAGDQPAGPLAGVDAPAPDRDGDTVTTSDQAGDQPAQQDPTTDGAFLVTVDEAKTALWELGGAVAGPGAVAEMLRQIILSGRDSRIVLEDPRRPMWQHASLEALEAYLADPAGKRVARVVKTLGRWRDVAERADAGHYLAQLYGEVAEAVAEQPAPAGGDAAYQALLARVQRAGAAGVVVTDLLGITDNRTVLYPLLRRAVAERLAVQPHPRGRWYWHECAPAPATGEAGAL